MFVCATGHCFTGTKGATCTKETQVEQGKKSSGFGVL